jgi:ADP-dependent NAD(P)H-hydrate dehydratase
MRSGRRQAQIATVDSAAEIALPSHARSDGNGLPRSRTAASRRVGRREDREHGKGCDAVVAGPGMSEGPMAAAAIADAVAQADLGGRSRSTRPCFASCRGTTRPRRECGAADAPAPCRRDGGAARLRRAEEVEADPLGCGPPRCEALRRVVLVKGAVSHIVAPPTGELDLSRRRARARRFGQRRHAGRHRRRPARARRRSADRLAVGVWLHGEAGACCRARSGRSAFLAREIPAKSRRCSRASASCLVRSSSSPTSRRRG